MIFDKVEVGEKYALNANVEFYNHRAGMFASFNKGLVVEVCRKNSEYHTPSIIVKFDGGKIEVYASHLETLGDKFIKEIKEALVEYFDDVTPEEASDRVNEWRPKEPIIGDHVIYHESPVFWAKTIYYKRHDWWRDHPED